MFNLELTKGRKVVRIDTFEQFVNLIQYLINDNREANDIWVREITLRDAGWFKRNAPIAVHTRYGRNLCAQWSELNYYIEENFDIISYDEILEGNDDINLPGDMKVLFD